MSTDLQEQFMRPKRKLTYVDYLIKFRWIFVIFVILPLSVAFDICRYLGDLWSEYKSFKCRQRNHEKNVQKVMKRIRQRDPKKDGLICTARKPYISVSVRNQDYKRARRYEVDLSAFRNILDIDIEKMIVRVEPLVTMGQITRVIVPMNLSLAVLPELNDLTVGGLINGYGIEGSSHIYGLFTDTVVAYELVLADGSLVRATADNEYSDLYYAVPWSQGTLGLLVAVEIKLIHIKEYMKLTYKPVKGSIRDVAQAYIECFTDPDGNQDTNENIPEFVEGFIYNEHEGVNMVGWYASKEEAHLKGNTINNYGWWFKPWFYQHAYKALEKGEFTEYIPTKQYYHRHTRSIFWECKLIIPFADQLWWRILLGWMMPPKVSFLKATQGDAIRNYYHERHIIQDLLIPLHKLPDCLEFSHKELELYPIWLCPHKLHKTPYKTMISPEAGYERHCRRGDTPNAQMYCDIGLYYSPNAVLRGEEFDGVEACKKIEKWLIENHGFQPLYAVIEQSEKEFWTMFNPELYTKCREKYKAVGTFMGIYYKSKKGRKTERDVMEEEQKIHEKIHPEPDLQK